MPRSALPIWLSWITVTLLLSALFAQSYFPSSPYSKYGFVMLGGIFAAGVLAGSVHKLFVQPQSRIVEWLGATIIAATLCLGVRTVWLEIGAPTSAGLVPCFVAVIVITMVATGCAWNILARLRELHPAARLRVLVAFWLAAVGFSAKTATVILTMSGETVSFNAELLSWVLFAVLCLPAIYVMMRAEETINAWRNYYIRFQRAVADAKAAGLPPPEKFVIEVTETATPPLRYFLMAPYLYFYCYFYCRRHPRDLRDSTWGAVEGEQLPAQIRALLESETQQFTQRMFDHAGYAKYTLDGDIVYVSYWTRADLGYATVGASIKGHCIEHNPFIAITTAYEDGGWVHTNAAPNVGILEGHRTKAGMHSQAVPGCRDLERLIAIHRAQVQRFKSEPKHAMLPTPNLSAIIAFINATVARQNKMDIEAGITERVGEFHARVTRRTAFIYSFEWLPGINQVLRWRRRRRIRAQLNNLEARG